MAAIQGLFLEETKEKLPPSDGITTEALALICVAAVVLAGSIFLVGFTYYKYKRYQRLQRLVHSLSRKNSIYETQETSVTIEEDMSDSISIQRLIQNNNNIPNGHAIGVVNPSFNSDDQPTTVSTEPQNAINQILEAEEPAMDYDNAVGATHPENIPDKDYEHVSDAVAPEPDQDYTDTMSPMNSETVPPKDYENVSGAVTHEPDEDYEQVTGDTENNVVVDQSPIESEVNQVNIVNIPTPQNSTIPPPPPPPLPADLSKVIKSSSAIDLLAPALSTKKVTKQPGYENVLVELQAAVIKIKANGEESSDDDAPPISVPAIKYQNYTQGLGAIDCTQSGKEEQNINDQSESDSLRPDEPEPDYAKRVHFNGATTIMDVPKSDDPVDKEDDSDHENIMNDLPHMGEIHTLNGETGTFLFNSLEITEF